MSDIGFHGLGAFLFGIAIVGIAGVAFLAEMLLWGLSRGQGRRNFPAFALFVPLAYGALGLWILYVAENGSLEWRRAADSWAWIIGGVALLLWVAVRAGAAYRNGRARFD